MVMEDGDVYMFKGKTLAPQSYNSSKDSKRDAINQGVL